MKYERINGESEEELVYRICQDKEQIGTWTDVSNILNSLLDYEYTESKYRKQFQAFQKMLNANREKFSDGNKQLEEINNKIRELQRETIKFRDQRNAWNKQNYIATRTDETLNILEEKMSKLGRTNFEVHEIPTIDGVTDLLVALSDLHIGQTFSSIYNEYNTTIAKERLNKYLNEIIKIGRRHNTCNIHVCLLGDEISGNIHSTIQITNKENVIEQVKTASEYITSFCYELTRMFKNVYLYGISGNHARLGKKDEVLRDERMDDLISWSVCNSLSHIDNFHSMLHRKLDYTIGEAHIRGCNYLLLHGDFDQMTKQSVGNLSLMLGFVPQYIVTAHRHFPAMSEFNGVTMYQSGSLAGSGDNYTMQNRLSGDPSQTVLVCDETGVQCCYNVNLK